MPRAKVIRDEKQLLDALRENPTRRAVAARSHSKRHGACLAVTEFADAEPSGSGRVIAWIKPGSAAHVLLKCARLADEAADAVTWASLPVRYGPYGSNCVTWLLPDHPRAPTVAGGDIEDIPF